MNPAELTGLFKKQFELCALKADENVVLLTNPDTCRSKVQAAFAAALELGAEAIEVGLAKTMDLQRVGHSLNGGSGLMAALKSADLLCTFFPPNLSPWLSECRQGGTRVLSITDNPERLKTLQSPPGLKEAVLHATDRYKRTKRVKVTSSAGTDLKYERGDPRWSEIRGYYGYADTKGRFDQWGMGMVADFPDEGTANGRVVVQPGDLWILPYARIIESEIHLEVRDGVIRSVNGGLDARLFRDWLDRNKRDADDIDPYAVSHMGFGLHPHAHWDDILTYGNDINNLTMSARGFPGNFLFSTGPGPHRRTKGHIDMPMCGCTVEFDDGVVIERGKLVDPAMIVDPLK